MDIKDSITVREHDVEYLQQLLGDHITKETILVENKGEKKVESIDYLKIKEAYSKAHEIRKFEIELYWKRANHFWLFMTALAGLVGFCITSSENYIKYISPALTLVGLIFGLAFFYANKGSKYWQENWERNLDMLEYYVSGDLYKLYWDTDEIKPSVSRVNLYVSGVIVVLWVLAFFCNVLFVSYKFVELNYQNLYLGSFIFLSLIVVVTSCIVMTDWHKPKKEEKNGQNFVTHKFNKRPN